jgi:hypothetical protein
MVGSVSFGPKCSVCVVSSFEIIAALVSNSAWPTVPGDMVPIQIVSSFEIIAALVSNSARPTVPGDMVPIQVVLWSV